MQKSPFTPTPPPINLTLPQPWPGSSARLHDAAIPAMLQSMHQQLLQTKCHMPAWHAYGVARPQLGAQLDAGLLAGHRLTLISAPAGYGKTTLATEWLRRAALPVAWLALDRHDNELRRFLAYLQLALAHSRWPMIERGLAQAQPAGATQQLDADEGDALPAVLRAPQLPPLAELAAAALQDMALAGAHAAAQGYAHLILAFDDYHIIQAAPIHDLLALLLAYLPPRCHLLLLTREDPPLPLARLRARGELTELRAQELRFTEAEAVTFFNQAMQLNLAPDWIATLEARTEGWIASLHLAALSLRGRDAAQTAAFIQAFGGSHRYVFDYLAEEVLAQQSAAVRAFLQQTAILDRFHAALCQAVTGCDDSQALLQRIEQANLFLVPLDDERSWYRYHHLFADYLRALLPSAQQNELYRRAVAWLVEHELWVDAVHYALATADAELVAAVIERALSGPDAWSSGNLTMLANWIDALPPVTFLNRPHLSLHAARILYLAGRFAQAEQLIGAAEALLDARGATLATEPLLALAAVYRGAIAVMRGAIQPAITQIMAAQAFLLPEQHLAHARAWFSLGLAYELADQTGQAIAHYEQASAAARTAGVLFLEIHAQGAAAQLELAQGRLGSAAQRCQAALERASGARIAPLGLIFVLLGGIALERNELSEASAHVQEGLALARQGGLWDDVVVGLLQCARLYAAQAQATEAFAAVDEAVALIARYGVPHMALRAASYQARLQLHLGQPQAATAWATAYQAARTAPLAEFEELTLARWLLASGAPAALAAIVLPLLAQARAAGRQLSCIEALLLLSLSAHASHDLPAALDWLSQAISLAAPEGYARIFLDAGPALSALLPGVRHVAPTYVDMLLAMAQPAGAAQPPTYALLSEPLSAQELRVLRLIVAGKSNQELAATLVISVGTAKWHVHNILQKLGVSSRPKAIARVRELGLLD